MTILLYIICFFVGVWFGSNPNITVYYRNLTCVCALSIAWALYLVYWFQNQDYEK